MCSTKVVHCDGPEETEAERNWKGAGAMVKRVTARRMGGSVGATFPKESVERFHIKAGDVLNIVDTPEGILITPLDPDFERAVEVYERGARKYRNALRELAK